MIVALNQVGQERKFQIIWKYSGERVWVKRKASAGRSTPWEDREITTCIINLVTGWTEPQDGKPGRYEVTQIASGRTMCSAGDCFTKEEGRKRSLARALDQGRTLSLDVWNPTKGPKPTAKYLDDGPFNVNDRKAIWEAYFNRKPKKVLLELTEADAEALTNLLMAKAFEELEHIKKAVERGSGLAVPVSEDLHEVKAAENEFNGIRIAEL